jgi:ABC-type multidrug transport system fused ATPase/permease subunit
MSEEDDDEESVPEEVLPPWPERVRVALKDSRWAIALVWNTHRGYASGVLLLSAIGAGLPASIAWVGRALVEAVIRSTQGDPGARSEALRWVALELFLVLLMNASSRTERALGDLLRALVGERVNEDILEKAVRLDLADFERAETYDLMTKARREASYRPIMHVTNVLSLVQTLVSLGALSALLATISGWAVVVVVIAALPGFLANLRFDKEAFRLFSWRTPETRKQNYLESVLAHANYAKEVKLFELGPTLLARYRAIFHALWDADRRLVLTRALTSVMVSEVGTLAFYGLYGWAVYGAASGQMSVADLTLCVLVLREGQGSVQRALGTVAQLWDDRQYLRTLFAFLEHASVDGKGGGLDAGPTPGDGIRFEDVTFRYPDADKPALDGLSLHLPAHHKLALVGENGAGKTTLIKLLTRLYQPTSGRILLDGLPLPEWNEHALRRRIGVIFQDFVQYQFTVGENIGVGDVEAIDDEARWAEAAERGMANEVIDKLPKGFHTQLGKWFQDGQELSLGQWQKVALARAFMRKDADVLVLDEPTASMDAEAEAKIFARFRALTEHRSAILISHRFSTVRMADEIAVLQGGKITEQGTHVELMERGGRYAELFTLQAQGYR